MTRSDQLRGRGGHGTNRVGYPFSWRSYNHSLKLLDNDEAEAFRLNRIAAEQGMHDAVLAMGWFYLNGVGIEVDEAAAFRWYRKSARQGDMRAMFSLGQIAYTGRDYTEALLWFRRAAEKGHHRSEFWIGKLYWKGHGVERDRRVAYQQFARAAAKKLPEAQRTLRYLSFLAQRTSNSNSK